MEKTEIEDKININVLNFKIFIITFILLIPTTIILAQIAQIIKYTVNQTYFTIFSLSLIFIIVCLLFKRTMKQIEIAFEKNDIFLVNKKTKQKSLILYIGIKSFNIYYLPIKKMGYIVRIKTSTNICFWIVRDSNENSDRYHNNFEKLNKGFYNLTNKKSMNYMDYLIQFLACLPWIILILGLLGLVGIFYYIFFII